MDNFLKIYEDHPNLREIHKLLFAGKTWRFLRYLHAREALKLTHNINTVIVIGVGHGIAELGLAIEFPNIEFTLTDFEGSTHSRAKLNSLIREYKINNVAFKTFDITKSVTHSDKYDLVYSIEVLEHIEQDELAAKNMNRLATKYIFCLVPFAETELNKNKVKRHAAFERHGHYVVGYDSSRLSILFPGKYQTIKGCYWRNGGLILRNHLTAIENFIFDEPTITNLHLMAFADVRNQIPKQMNDAQGIWILSEI